MDDKYKNLLQAKLADNKRKQEKIKLDKQISFIKDNVNDFDKKYSKCMLEEIAWIG